MKSPGPTAKTFITPQPPRPRIAGLTARCIAAFLALCAGPHVLRAQQVGPIPAEQAAEYGLDRSFFKKGTMSEGILIATSEQVSDVAHRETAYVFGKIMQALRPEIASRIRDGKVLCILVGSHELTSDIPPFRSDKTGKELDFYNWRNRGFLNTVNGRPAMLFAEEDVLEYEGGMQLESILVHEFGHLIHRPGFCEGMDDELKKTWQAAMDAGLWNDGRAAQKFRRVKGTTPVRLLDALKKSFPDQSPDLLRICLDSGDILVNGAPTNSAAMVTGDDKVLIVFGGPKDCYGRKNRGEMVQNWFDTNRTMDHDHNHIHTREQLRDYDPGACKFLQTVFRTEDEWRFVSPRDRAGTGHLKDFDPAQAPVIVKPDFIEDAANDYYDTYWASYWSRLYDKHKERLSTAATGRPHDPPKTEGPGKPAS
jgi:hypothetical protein